MPRLAWPVNYCLWEFDFNVVFMFLTTLVSLSILLMSYIRKRNYVLIAADLTLFLLSIGVIGLFVKMFVRKKTEAAAA